jgi:flavin reductase (DIM6/NTAB) family NADH-FMN oxidoreductase RutF
VCLVMVRYTRYTYKLIEEAGAFTVNVPSPDMERVMDFCGSHSGCDVDKIRELGLAASPAKMVPGIILDDCALTYECHVVGKYDTLPKMLAEEVITSHYTGGAKEVNYHRLYVGEIVHLPKKGTMAKHFDDIILAILTLLKTREERATILALGDNQNGKWKHITSRSVE